MSRRDAEPGAHRSAGQLSRNQSSRLNGCANHLCVIERADSITLDPHKWFAQPFEAGCLLVRDGDGLARAFSMRPEYMQDVIPHHDEINFCDHGIALTRRFRALKIWFSIKLLGLAWHRRLIEHSCALAAYAQALLEAAGCFKITSPRQLGIVCFRYVRAGASNSGDDALQQALAEQLLRTGRAFLSTTRLNGRTTLRFCFVNWRTTAADVEEIVGLLHTIGAPACATMSRERTAICGFRGPFTGLPAQRCRPVLQDEVIWSSAAEGCSPVNGA